MSMSMHAHTQYMSPILPLPCRCLRLDCPGLAPGPPPIGFPLPLPSLSCSSVSSCRRVYDALNVLEALDIIAKEKKEVKWKGFPETQGAHQFALQRMQEQARQVEQKEMKLRALVGQFVAFKQLVARNRQRASAGAGAGAAGAAATPPQSGQPSSEGSERGGGAPSPQQTPRRIQMPFLLVQTQTPSVVDCEMGDDGAHATFTFQHPFSVHDDTEVLRGLGLQSPSPSADLARMGLPDGLHRFAQGESARTVRLDAPKTHSSSAAAAAAAAAAAPTAAPTAAGAARMAPPSALPAPAQAAGVALSAPGAPGAQPRAPAAAEAAAPLPA